MCLFSGRYELIERGAVAAADAGLVPDVYTRNQQLETEIMSLKKDLESCKRSVTCVIWFN